MRVAILVLLLQILPGCYAQINATQPASAEVIRAADDFASRAFQDPWDMNQRTDLGWFTYGIDSPRANLNSISLSGGIFSATSANTDPNFWLLDSGNPFAANLGKTGKQFPIASTKYKRLVMRMSLTGAGISTANPGQAQILWSNNTIYNGINTSNSFFTWPGWWIYSVNMETLGVAAGASWTSANVDSLRVDPLSVSGINISLDWARLVEDVPAQYRTIQWTGSGAVDIFLDNDTNSANGFLGQIARSITGNTYSFYVGGLPQGTYYVVVCPAGAAGPYSYAPGNWQIQDIPLLSFTSPSPEGSSDDFATTQLNNAWDMDALSDIDTYKNVNGLQIANILAQNEQGDSLGSTRVLQGTSVASPGVGSGDPYVYPLWFQTRGNSTSIDTSRYRILTLEMGVSGDRDINNGSIARIVWMNRGESVENVSDDIILNHLSSANVIQKINLDMKTLALDPSNSPSRTGWNGLVDSFRVDPHEFSDARTFWIKSVKLTALETAASAYTIRWSYTAQGASGVSLALFYDLTGTGFSGTQIASGLDPFTGAYAWDISALANGTYYVYGVLSIGGSVVNQAYAPWPLVVDHSYQILPTLALGRSTLNFGATVNGATVTGPQEITVTVKGSGAVNWSAATDRSWLVVSPSSGSGTGRFTVSVQSTALPAPSFMDGTVTVTAAGTANSPQYVRVFLNTIVAGTTAGPFGIFDTPADGATGLSGNVAVTGWALDDVQVKKVTLWRDKVGAEPVGGNGLIYIGDAVFVPDARTDVEALYPDRPMSYRAGWGYLMLTTGLPPTPGHSSQGNGVYRLTAYAEDLEGHQTLLGTKNITVDNASSMKPFGTLDTPGQGETISGTAFVNFGWALTPMPASIPVDGSTIGVSIDGVFLPGHPVYGLYRSDIATGFPGYANSSTGVGYLYIDSTQFPNGLHNIGWLVTDSANRTDGIGSRFFNIFNTTAGAALASAPASVSASAPASAAVPSAHLARALRRRTTNTEDDVQSSTVAFRKGYDLRNPVQAASFDPKAKAYVVEAEELERIELRLPGGIAWSGTLLVGAEARPLPPGSTWDEETGRFYWQLGPGQLGSFQIAWHPQADSSGEPAIRVLIRVRPKFGAQPE